MSYPPPQTGYPDYPIPAGQPGCPPPTGDLGYPSSGGQPGYPPPPGASPPMEPPPADTPHGTQAPLPQRQQQTVDAPQQKKSKGVSRSFVHNFSQAIVSLGNDVGKCFSRNGRVFNVAELKRQKEQPTPESRPSHKRRVSDDGNDAVTKKTKQNAETTEKAGGIVSLGSYDSSDNDDDNENEKDKEDESSPANSNQLKNQLPPDFFDKDVQPGSSAEQAVGDELLTKSASMADALPEGFFDNPVEDAKVRQVEYKDKMDDEWELFQKAMKEEKLVSEAIIEDEEEHITEERNIEEIDDQMRRWSKVHALAQKKEQIMQEHNLNSAKGSESDSDIDEQAFDEFLDWRSKSAWKS